MKVRASVDISVERDSHCGVLNQKQRIKNSIANQPRNSDRNLSSRNYRFQHRHILMYFKLSPRYRSPYIQVQSIAIVGQPRYGNCQVSWFFEVKISAQGEPHSIRYSCLGGSVHHNVEVVNRNIVLPTKYRNVVVSRRNRRYRERCGAN